MVQLEAEVCLQKLEADDELYTFVLRKWKNAKDLIQAQFKMHIVCQLPLSWTIGMLSLRQH